MHDFGWKGGHKARGGAMGGHKARGGAKGGHKARGGAKGGHKARPYDVVVSSPMVVGAPLVGVPSDVMDAPVGVGVPSVACHGPLGMGGHKARGGAGDAKSGHKARGGAGDAKGGHKARPYGVVGSAPMVVGAPLVGVPFDVMHAPVGVGGHKARGGAKGGHKARPYDVVVSSPMVVGAPLVGVPSDVMHAPVGVGGHKARVGRRSIRLWKHDYSSDGAYFVTITTQNRMCVFGNVIRGEMHLNAAGRMAAEQWRSLQRRFDHVLLDAFVIMPNHMHGILWLTSGDGVPRLCDAPDEPQAARPGLGQIVGAFKSTSTVMYGRGVRTEGWRPFHKRLWLRNYYESVIRSDEHLRRARAYIANNPRKWTEQRERYERRRRLEG